MLKQFFFLAALCAISTGCGRNLYHYHRTVVGVDISGNVAGDTPSGHLTVGYSRRLVILMPPEMQGILDTKAKVAPGEELKADAKADGKRPAWELPSTVFCTQVKASLGGVNSFREILATGNPAENYADRLVKLVEKEGDTKYRNLVCPNFEIPKPSKDSNEPMSAEETKK
jgi:hypothetical protein